MPETATKAQPLEIGHFIGGEFVKAGERVEVRSPFDGSLVGITWNVSAEAMEEALAQTTQAAAAMRELPAFRRAQILRGIAAGVERHKEELARTLTREAGKPLKAARVEVERAAFTFSIAAEEATRIGGEVLPLDLLEATAGRFALVRRFPVGPVAAFTPFNFPINLVAHKAGPAIAAGCPLLLKPAPQTPFSALRLGEIAREAGLPAGAWNILPCANEVAEKMVTDPRMKLLSFTGSAAVGWELRQKAGRKRVALELGGNAGVIIERDADLEYAAERCTFGGFSYAGQSCISVQRILVHREVRDAFLAALVPRVKKLRMGDPLEESTDIGPLIRRSDAERVSQWIEEAVRGGAEIVTGGKRNGSMVEPTVLTGTRPEMKVNFQEVFGPVVSVEAYDDFSAALATVNDTPYGLQAGVFTRDARRIFEAYSRLEVGGVVAGDVPTFRIDHMPYGGVKESGTGREGLRYAIEEMTEPKLLVMNLK